MIDRMAVLLTALTFLGGVSARAQAAGDVLGGAYSALSDQAARSRKAEGVLAAQPGQSSYAILKDFYEKASTPAELADFDLVDDIRSGKSNQRCVMSKLEKAGETFPAYLFRAIKAIPGVPAAGPLIPGTPDRNETKFILASDPAVDVQADDLWDSITVSRSATDLSTRSTKYAQGPATTSTRKSGGFIAFKLQNDDGSAARYGYCYRK